MSRKVPHITHVRVSRALTFDLKTNSVVELPKGWQFVVCYSNGYERVDMMIHSSEQICREYARDEADLFNVPLR